ncbi:ATP-binding protein [Spirochaetia bacterium]|nr:ATP-binding protein [Spirochaetia bacterium]
MGDRVPNEDEKIRNLAKIDSLLNKVYLHDIESRYDILNFADYNKIPEAKGDEPQYKIITGTNVRALRVDRWVFDKEEQSIDKFKNILNVFAGGDSNFALLIHRDKDKAVFHFILKNETTVTSKSEISDSNAKLLKSAIVGNFNGTCVTDVTESNDLIPQKDKIQSIACLTNIPSEKSEKFISQGLEKLLDGIKPDKDDESYYVLILAEPLSHSSIHAIQSGYEELASAIAPYSGYQFSVGKNNTETEGTMQSLTNSENIFSAITKTHSVSVSAGVQIPTPVGGVNLGASYSFSHSKTEGKGSGSAETSGKNYNLSTGTTENTTYNYQSFAIKGLLEKLQKQLERVNNGQSLGFWKCASYVLSNSPITSINVANFLKSLTQGDESYVEPPIINTWNDGNPVFDNIAEYLCNFTHPVFGGSDSREVMTPTYNVSTTELSEIMAFPRKSVSGLPVLECAEFGREVVTLDRYEGDIQLGSPYHMHRIEKHQPPIKLNKKSLASHTFITGSTGSGKSNTIYQLLSEIKNSDCHFLVVEPAKGEYKNVFGNDSDVSVYGTNPDLMPLLRINPFTFPHGNADSSKNIHILEHLDRLIEIFNVCWPMYAAMPAVLKDAIEVSYEEKGWDLATSKNCDSPARYPTFADVKRNIRTVIDSSDYSDENKGNYKGSLITRLKSLSNGIYGLIFTNNELSNKDLFDKNVIVDLSRIGSIETKALIMGIIVMKLQEYRTTSGQMNSDLQHVTVLEEAHNLLKRTSTEQSSESSNLLGKSVEMLANAIAEMRTYGEGFIIADQAPGLLDMSVIRNTNTKIILRLPDESDRELVGKAASLNDDQIVELAKLQCGVAAVYQNDWLEAVLCKVDEFTGYDKSFLYKKPDLAALKKANAVSALKRQALSGEKTGSLKELIDGIDFDEFKTLNAETVLRLFDNGTEVVNAAYRNAVEQKTKLPGLYDYLAKHLEPTIQELPREHKQYILRCLVEESCKNDASMKEIPVLWQQFLERSVK